MEKTRTTTGGPKNPLKKLPSRARWLIGWAAVMALAVLLVYYWRVAFWLGDGGMTTGQIIGATAGVCGVFSLLYLCLFLLCRFAGQRPWLRAAVLVFVCGLLFCFATAPMQVPDERAHYLRAQSLSIGRLTYDADETFPQDVSLLLERFPGDLNHRVTYQQHEMAPAVIEDYLAAKDAGEAPETEAESPIMYMNLPFALQAVFMAASRLFGLGALGALYAGRLANLLVYALISCFTFKNCGRYRGVFYAFALMPLSLFMAASCSYDSIMLACCYYLLSFFCKEEVHSRDLVWFAAALGFAVFVKPNNFVLAAVLLLVPKTRWKSKLNPRLVTLGITAGVLLFWFVMAMAGGGGLESLLKRNWGELPRGSGDASDPAGQMLFILQNPPRFAATTLLTIYENNAYLFDLGRLGAMDLNVPLVGGLSLLCAAACAALGIQQKEDTRPGAAVGLLLAALLYSAAILGGMYVLDTDYLSIRITGTQPRYFLPAFVLLFMLASILLGKAVRPKLLGNGGGGAPALQTPARTEAIALWIAAGVAVVGAVLLFQNYYVGQWLTAGDGSWKLVNLFGWMKV